MALDFILILLVPNFVNVYNLSRFYVYMAWTLFSVGLSLLWIYKGRLLMI